MKKVLWLVLLLLSGCAAVFDGSEQKISVDSNVKGVSVFANGQKIGETPFQGLVTRQGNFMLHLEKEGYESQNLFPDSGFNPITGLNVLLGPLSTTGITVDATTEAWIEYLPDHYYVTMEAKGGASDRTKKENRIRTYILDNHQKLFMDSLAGGGEHLVALADLINITSETIIDETDDYVKEGDIHRYINTVLQLSR